MNRVFLLLAGLCLALAGHAQTDTTRHEPVDTLRVGNLLIIRNGVDQSYSSFRVRNRQNNRKAYRPSNFSTNWGIVDIGFANFNDKTNYSGTAAQQFAPGSTKDWFK